VIIEHNTVRNSGPMLMILYKGMIWPAGASPRAAQYAIRSLTFRNNLAYHNQYGVFGDEGAGLGATALNNLTRQQTWSHNVLANREGQASYPGTNWYPSRSEHEAQFNADHTLVAGSKYRRAGSDGHDLGRLAAATEGGQRNFSFPPSACSVHAVFSGSRLDIHRGSGCLTSTKTPRALWGDAWVEGGSSVPCIAPRSRERRLPGSLPLPPWHCFPSPTRRRLSVMS
jgi:hypothetical protein